MKMKKTLFFALFVIMLVTVLASCSSISNIKCMEPFNKHNIVIDKAVDPTCTTTGLTQGEHCADCGMVFVAQTIIPEIAHTEVVDAAVESTCTKPGLTEGSHCSECGLVFVMQEETAMKPHRETTSYGYAPTCTTDGRTDRIYCADCKVEIVPSTVIPGGHVNVITIDALDSTCASVGFTEGKFCVDCMTMIDGYLTIPKKPHTAGEWVVEKDATKFEAGRKYQPCTVCGGVANEEVIPQLADFEYVVNADGVTCTVTGVTVYANIDLYIPEYIDGYKVTAIGDDAFANQTQIYSVHIPGSVVSIGARAFSGCTTLTAVEIPEGVASIGVAAFYNCGRLAKIILPASLTSIGHSAFDMCVKLTSVYYAGARDMWSNIEIGVNNDAIISVDNRYYYFADDPRTSETGIFRDNGNLYLYVNGVKTPAGLVVIDGGYYYARTSGGDFKGIIVTGTVYTVTVTNDLLPKAAYTFDANGKMIDPPVEPGEDTVEITRYWHYVDGTPTKW